MKTIKILSQGGALALSLLACAVMAAVSPEEAGKLGTTLTPVGAELAGNADGSIPPWNGGLSATAGTVDANGFLADPFAAEAPLFTITAQNAAQYQERLTPGQLALFKRYPDSYRIPVFPSHRSAGLPSDVLAAVKRNATRTQLVAGGNGLENFESAIPFPIPQSGLEAIWNHITRYRGGSVKRLVTQATPQANGTYSLVYFQDEFTFPKNVKNGSVGQDGNVLFYFKQRVTAPSRLAGNVLLVHETIDQVKEPRMAWVYNAGQRRVRRAPQVAYDGPGTAADGMRTADNFDLFSGAPDRYDWKLVGKKEMYIPYNANKVFTASNAEALLAPHHLNPDSIRWELHRVWVVEATLKNGQRHVMPRSTYYLDEDTWAAVLGERYDARNQLAKVVWTSPVVLPDLPGVVTLTNGFYDLLSGAWFAGDLFAGKNEQYRIVPPYKDSVFTADAMAGEGVR